MRQLKYKRILLKLSGELLGQRGSGIESQKITCVVGIIKTATHLGVEIAIAVGGGNWWRKRDGDKGIKPATSDYMGMIGTVLNGLALSSYLQKTGVKTLLQAHLVSVPGIEPINIQRARRALKSGRAVVFAGGTGKPHVTTDTAAAQLAREINAEVIFKVGEVDGVYTADPDKNKHAKKYQQLTFSEAQKNRLKIFDFGAYGICQRARIPVSVFKWSRNNLLAAVLGKNVGTIILP